MNALTQYIQISNNQATTTSEFIAQAFGKRHADVLRKIDELLTQVPDYFNKRNFAFNEKTVKVGFGERVERICELTKDGFMLLVMGFTGKQAMQIKIAYIEAFNAMVEQIKQLSGSPKTTADDRTGLRQAVSALVGKRHIDYSDAYTLIHQRFGVAHIDELTHTQIPQAIEYVHRLTIDKSLHGEVLDRLPEKSSALHLSEQDLRSLSCVIRFMPYLLAYYHLTEDAVRSLNHRLCGKVHDRFSDAYLHACHLARSLNIEQQDWRKAVQEIQLHANLI